MESCFINPFISNSENLCNISTGVIASPQVEKDLLFAKEIGENAYQQFKKEQIESQEVDFHSKLSKKNLKTFTNPCTKRIQSKGREIIIKADRNMFARMIVIAKGRELSMKDVLCHPLGPIPWALAKKMVQSEESRNLA